MAPLVLNDTSGDLSLPSTWLVAHPQAAGGYENRNYCAIRKAECSDALMLSFSLQGRCILHLKKKSSEYSEVLFP